MINDLIKSLEPHLKDLLSTAKDSHVNMPEHWQPSFGNIQYVPELSTQLAITRNNTREVEVRPRKFHMLFDQYDKPTKMSEVDLSAGCQCPKSWLNDEDMFDDYYAETPHVRIHRPDPEMMKSMFLYPVGAVGLVGQVTIKETELTRRMKLFM